MKKTVETIGKDTASVGWKKDYRWHKWTPPAQPQGAWRVQCKK